MKRLKVLITCGPTWVAIDQVRVISNTSSGEMGHLIADELRKVNAQVTLLEGQVTHAWEANGVNVIKYRFFYELAKILKAELLKKYDVVIHAAAVSDFKVAEVSKTKIVSDKPLNLRLIPAEKLINSIKRLAPNAFLVGFKLESKLNVKNIYNETKKLFVDAACDLVVANAVNKGYQGFIVNADGKILINTTTKNEVAKGLVSLIV